MRNTGGGWLWVSASDDDGQSWTLPVNAGFANPASPAALLRLESGNLVLVFNDSPTERRPLSIAISPDEGLTWPHRRVIAGGETTYAYPSVVQTVDGLIHIVYSYGRDHIRHIELNEAWIVAVDDSTVE
jgi:predicted neuraminidase